MSLSSFQVLTKNRHAPLLAEVTAWQTSQSAKCEKPLTHLKQLAQEVKDVAF